MKWNRVLLNSVSIIPTSIIWQLHYWGEFKCSIVKFTVKKHLSSSGKETVACAHVLHETSSESLFTQTILTSNFDSILGVISNRKAV